MYNCPESTAKACCEQFESFQNCWKASVLESLFDKVTEEIPKFFNSARTQSSRLLFQKVALLEIPRNSVLTGGAGFLKAF